MICDVRLAPKADIGGKPRRLMVFSELVIGLPAWRLMASRWPVVTGTGQQRLRWLRRDSPSKDVSSKWQQRGTGYAEVHRTREVVLCGRLFGLCVLCPRNRQQLGTGTHHCCVHRCSPRAKERGLYSSGKRSDGKGLAVQKLGRIVRRRRDRTV